MMQSAPGTEAEARDLDWQDQLDAANEIMREQRAEIHAMRATRDAYANRLARVETFRERLAAFGTDDAVRWSDVLAEVLAT